MSPCCFSHFPTIEIIPEQICMLFFPFTLVASSTLSSPEFFMIHAEWIGSTTQYALLLGQLFGE